MCNYQLTPPLPVPSPDEKGGGSGVGSAPPPCKTTFAMETTTRENSIIASRAKRHRED